MKTRIVILGLQRKTFLRTVKNRELKRRDRHILRGSCDIYGMQVRQPVGSRISRHLQDVLYLPYILYIKFLRLNIR